jgi:NADH-quinone oxidoreductase subunit N
MSSADFIALSPLLVLSAATVLLMLQIAFLRSVTFSALLAAVGLALAALSCVYAAPQAPVQVTPLLLVDHLALLFCALFSLAGAVTVLLSLDYIQCHGDEPEEYFLLLILSTLGACVLASAKTNRCCHWKPPPNTWCCPARRWR